MQRLMPDNYGHYEGHISRAASNQARPGVGSRQSVVGLGVSAILTQLIYRLPGRQTLPHASYCYHIYPGSCLSWARFAVPTTQSQSQSQFPVALSGGVRVHCARYKIIMEGEAKQKKTKSKSKPKPKRKVYANIKKNLNYNNNCK